MGYEILKENHQKLYSESEKAEKYIETDFETSIEKVNKILEVLCKELYQKNYNEELLLMFYMIMVTCHQKIKMLCMILGRKEIQLYMKATRQLKVLLNGHIKPARRFRIK